MILQTYSSHLLELSWVITNSSNTNGLYDYILIKLRNQDNNNQFSTQVVSLTNKETFNCETISTHENLNVNFYTSIIKKYGITKSEGKYIKPEDNKIMEECKNLSSLGNVDNIINFFNEDDSIKNIQIEDCDNIINKNRIKSNGNGWDGNDLTDGTDIIDVKFDFKGDGIRGALQNKNQLLYDTKTYPKYPSVQSKPFTYVNKTESAAEWTYDKGKVCEKACCAMAVRMGLEGGSNFTTNGRPNSASRYWEYLSHWGYNQRYIGYLKDYGGVYQSGDIIVVANYTEAFREQHKLNQKNHIHGHIQTVHDGHFCSYAKNEKKGAWEAQGKQRPCYIFRAPSNKPQLNTNSGAICSPIENNDYKPSSEIIEFIKIKEGFREKWYKCPSGNWTIGYGFQETTELRKKYPNSITKDEASIILENQKIPYFVNGLKQTMGDYFGCYNQDQLDALLDLCYNVGVNGFSKNKSPKLHAALKSHNIANILANMNHGASSYEGVRKRREENRLWFQGRKKEVMDIYK